MLRIAILIGILVCSLLVVSGRAEIVWLEDWEDGWNDWYATNGIWEIGDPNSPGPTEAYSELNCAGTVLSSTYPNNANTRLVGPVILIPNAEEHPRLKFFHWYKFRDNDDDFVYVQLLVNDEWINISSAIINDSPIWTPLEIDLTPYAGLSVRPGFYFESDVSNGDAGWYMDYLTLEKGEWDTPFPDNTENFEAGIGDWYASAGIWEVGIPGSPGPGAAYEGENCAGTILDARYPNYANSRLTSPAFPVPPAGVNPRLTFYHWFKFTDNDPDYGYVQVKIDHPDSNWITIGGPFNDDSPVWSLFTYPLNDYSDRMVKLGFLLQVDRNGVDAGWYIDFITIQQDSVSIRDDTRIPSKISLFQNYPNPFNSSTLISYELPSHSDIKIDIFDIVGRKIATIQEKEKPAGVHNVIWNAENLSSGVYFYKLQADDFEGTRRMILVK